MMQYLGMATILALAACSPPPATTTTETTTTTTVQAVPLPPAPVVASGPPNPSNCGTPDMPQACPPMPRVPLRNYPANK
jgi:hypothetical protein